MQAIWGVKEKGSEASLFSMQIFLMPLIHPHPLFYTDPQALTSIILEPTTSISFPLESTSSVLPGQDSGYNLAIPHRREKPGNLTASL